MNSPSCKVIDQKKNGGYATPAESAGSFLTYISRIRRDLQKKSGKWKMRQKRF